MSEIERAIEYFEGTLKNANEFLSKGIGCEIMAKQKARLELIIPILRAELDREKNPLTVEDVVSEAYDRGYNLGYSDGYQDGTKGEEPT